MNVLTARCYASAVLAMPCVCLSVRSLLWIAGAGCTKSLMRFLGQPAHYVLKVASIDVLSFLVACHCTIFIANLLLCILGKFLPLMRGEGSGSQLSALRASPLAQIFKIGGVGGPSKHHRLGPPMIVM